MPTTVIQYPLDLTGNLPGNRITGEVHGLVTNANRAIVPNYGPFYTRNLVVRSQTTGQVLTPEVHYKAVQLFPEATLKTGQEICSVIVIVDNTLGNQFSIDYNTIGGDYSSSVYAIQQLIDSLDIDERAVQWGQIIGRPTAFPPAPHLHDLGDVYGFEFIVAALESVRRAILTGGSEGMDEIYAYIDAGDQNLANAISGFNASLSAHIADQSNPHNTTKAQVGLGAVQNFGLATTQEAVDGLINTAYMTPLRVAEAINFRVGGLGAHVTRTDNPHNTTKTQVGLGNVDNYLTASLAEAEAGTRNDRFMTPFLVRRAIIAYMGGGGGTAPPTVSLSPSPLSNTRSVSGSSGTIRSDFVTPTLGGGNGSYAVAWTIADPGGRGGVISIETQGNQARLVLNASGMNSVGAFDQVVATLRCTVTSDGLTTTADVVVTLRAERAADPAPTITLSPTSVNNIRDVTADGGNVFSDFITPTLGGGNGTYSVSWAIVNNGGRPADITLQTSGNQARLLLNYNSLTTVGFTDQVTVVFRATVTSGGQTATADVTVFLQARRISSGIFAVGFNVVSGGSYTKNQNTTQSSTTVQSDVMEVSYAVDRPAQLTWAIVDYGGRAGDLSLTTFDTIPSSVPAGDFRARVNFTARNMNSAGQSDSVTLVLRITMSATDGSGRVEFMDRAITLSGTRVSSGAPTVSVTPNPLTNVRNVTATSATVFSDYATPTGSLGDGNYTFTWSIINNGGRGADIAIEQLGNQARLSFAARNMTAAGVSDTVNATLRCTVSSAGQQGTIDVPVNLTATRVSSGVPTVTLNPTSVNNVRDLQADSGTVVSDFITPSSTLGDGNYTYTWSVVNDGGRPGAVAVQTQGNQGRLAFTVSGLSGLGATDVVTATLRCTVSSAGQSSSADVVVTLRANRVYPQLPPLQNLGFESGDVGWTKSGSAQILSGAAFSGSWFARITWNGGASSGFVNQGAQPILPGQPASVACRMRAYNAADQVGGQIRLIWLNVEGVEIGSVEGSNVGVLSGPGWNISSASGIAPAGAAYFTLQGEAFVVRSSGVVEFDSFDPAYAGPPGGGGGGGGPIDPEGPIFIQ